MTVLIGLLVCLAPFTVAAWYRDGHRRRIHRATVDGLRHELSTLDGTVHMLRRRLHWERVNSAIERRKRRRAEEDRDALQLIAAGHLRQVWALTADNERLLSRVERLELEPARRVNMAVIAEAEAVVHAIEAGER